MRLYYYISFIENADATPPHLDVLLRLGSSVDMLGLWNSFATGSSVFCMWSWTLVAVLMHVGCLEGIFGVFWGMWRPLWEALAPSPQLGRNKWQKVSEIWPPKESLWAPRCPLWALWGALLRPRTPKSAPRSVQKTILVASRK